MFGVLVLRFGVLGFLCVGFLLLVPGFRLSGSGPGVLESTVRKAPAAHNHSLYLDPPSTRNLPSIRP